ncbi:glycerophosphodiester phosphodiesterase [Alicyclobacillus dauci]|uniref:Glycerophosphodiester phosphodiesterase n=1 Tax=Alicyclobacillus dauci TaxID=1475485 RepID=A0ABY6YZ06_9BACL|nr:glycerophosphodiester phosphodiesterase [Alicyclobacillus dauci]WAH35740.1 glycerophosphodiester phosphodiesterase [Alicyclobacillus dauci]
MPHHPYTDSDDFLLMAHRGASMAAPANTWPAFDMAIKMGANVIETDVHWTKDGVLVVCHDDVVDNVSNGRGQIAAMTYRELQRLDFGYRFTPDGGRTYPFRGRGIRIPTFNELLGQFPGIRINVDLKPKEPRVGSFLRIIEEHGAFDRVVLASFHHATLVEARSRCKRVATSASTWEVVQFLLRLSELRTAFTKWEVPYVALQVPNKVWGHTLVNRNFVKRAHELGADVHVWTVNDAKVMSALLDVGVDGIITDCPDVLQQTLSHHGHG